MAKKDSDKKEKIVTDCDNCQYFDYDEEYGDYFCTMMLDEDEIDASMDLSVCSEEGIYEIPLTINVPEGYEVNGEVKITVNATPANTEQDEKDTEVYITQAKPGAGDEEDE